MSTFIIFTIIFLSIIGYGNYKAALGLGRHMYCDINVCDEKSNECDFIKYKS